MRVELPTIALAASLYACNLGGGVRLDAGGDAETFEAGDVSHEDGPSGNEGSGPITLVVRNVTIEEERLCDLDGDGQNDNSVADLGSPHAALLATTLSAVLQGVTQGDPSRVLVHMPWVEDLSGPNDEDTKIFFLRGEDSDQPGDPADDFSGEESFFFHDENLTPCGEPLFQFAHASIDAGQVSAPHGTVGAPIGERLLELTGELAEGQLEPGGAEGHLTACVHPTIEQLGAIQDEIAGELSALEAFLAGGVAFGLPGVPGLIPDLDLDGDGLESFDLDQNGHLVRCIDGDNTVIDGADCWQDPRIVDSFSLVVRFDVVPAEIEGPVPTWWSTTYAHCDDPEAGASAWGPCPAGDVCERWTIEECSPSCGGEGSQRCLWDCSGWTACSPSASEAYGLDSCDVLTEEGASCRGTPPVVQLAGEEGETVGFRLNDRFTVGRGPVTIEARVRASRGTTEHPGLGWAIVAYLDETGESWTDDREGMLGINHDRIGWAFLWSFARSWGDESSEPNFDDEIILRALLADSSWESIVDHSHRFLDYGPHIQPALNANTVEEVTQRLRLYIEPDLPETEDNELVVTGSIVDEEGIPIISVGCFAWLCPEEAQLQVGDSLQIGMSSATRLSNDAQIAVHAEDQGGFTVEVSGVCP